MAMGGGSMMRAVAKVAGAGVVNTGIRSGVVPADTPISAAARAAVSRPIGAIATKSPSSTDSVKTCVAIDSSSSVEKPRWAEIGDWEFAGGDEEIIALTGSGDPLPRLVFGGPPTVEEAKKATVELKDALEKVYASSPRSNGYESLHGSGHSSGLLLLSNTDVNENKVCLSSATPNHAIQAFRFLDQSPEVQGVVASIVSDPNVWDAVLQNPALQGYLQSHIGISASVHQNVGDSRVQGDIYYQKSPVNFEEESETGKSEETGKSSYKNEFLNFWKNIKLAVVDMMSNLSDFFNSIVEGQGDDKDTAKSNPIPPVVEKLLGPWLMGVVVMVIMLVVLKRA